MANLKQGLTLSMPVNFANLIMSEVSQIEFTFRQTQTPGEGLKTAVYKADNSGDCTRNGNVVYVPWTQAETYLFKPNATFFMDTRITMNDTTDQPVTPIVRLVMAMTLFEEQS